MFNFLRNCQTISHSGSTIFFYGDPSFSTSSSKLVNLPFFNCHPVVCLWFLICISLMDNDGKHLFIYSLAIWIFSLEKCLSRSFVCYLINLILFNTIKVIIWLIPCLAKWSLYLLALVQFHVAVRPTRSVSWRLNLSSYQLGFSRETESVGDTYLYLSFKESVYAVVGADKSEIHRTGWQAGNSGRIFVLQPWEFFFLQETSDFVFKAFNWLEEPHPHYQW